MIMRTKTVRLCVIFPTTKIVGAWVIFPWTKIVKVYVIFLKTWIVRARVIFFMTSACDSRLKNCGFQQNEKKYPIDYKRISKFIKMRSIL